MLEPLGNLIRRWHADPRPATTLALCQALAEAGEAHRSAPPRDWAQYVDVCAGVGRVVAERFALDLDVLLAAGRMHLAAGATWDAQSATLQAAKIAPDEPRGWVLLGEALLRRGDALRAARSFERASAAGVRVDPGLDELARTLAAQGPAPREALAEMVAHRLGYAAIPPPPGMPSFAVAPPSAPPPSVTVPRAPALPTLGPDVPLASMVDADEEPGEMTVRHEFDRDELMALLRASEDGESRRASIDEESTRERVMPVPPNLVAQRAPVHSDAFTLVRGQVDDETTTDTHDVPTTIGQVPQSLLDEVYAARDGRPPIPRPSGSFDEVVPTIARQLAPRSRHVEHHPTPRHEASGEGIVDEPSEDTHAFRRAEILVPPRTRQPVPAPAARVIVDPPSRSDAPPPPRPELALDPRPPPHVMVSPTSVLGRDPTALPGLVDEASGSAERPLPPGVLDDLGHATEGRGRSSRRRMLGWIVAGAVLAAGGAIGARAWQRQRTEGDVEEAREAARGSMAALDAGDLRLAQELGDRAAELAPHDPQAVRATIDARIVGVLDGASTADAAVDVLTTARRLGAGGVVLAAAALAAAVGAQNDAHARTLLEQHRRDGVDQGDAIYRLAEGAALDLTADPAAVDAYARARELRPALGSAMVRHVRALVFAGRIGEARTAAGGVEVPKVVAGALDVLLARAAQPERWPEREARIAREDVGDLPRPLRTIGAALALVPPESQGGQSMGLDAALDDADVPASLLLAGQLALSARDLDGALGAARRAIAMEPEWAPAHALSARVLLLRGQLDEALALEKSLPPAVAAEVRAIAAYESGDPDLLAEAESRAVETGVARWPALALALARLRSGPKRPGPAEADGLLAEGATWADVLAVDLALDAGDLERASRITGGWSSQPDPARALRLVRLRRIKGDLVGAEAMIKAAGPGRWARVEAMLLAADTRAGRKQAIAALDDRRRDETLGDLTPFLLAYLRGREGAFQAAKATVAGVKVPRGGPLEGRVVALLGLAAGRDPAGAKGLLELVDALRGRPEVVWAGVMLGELPPTRMPKGMK